MTSVLQLLEDWPLLAATAVGLWLAGGLLDGLRSRLGERFAEWALPEGQRVGFRAACVALDLADRVGARQTSALPERFEDVFFEPGIDIEVPEGTIRTTKGLFGWEHCRCLGPEWTAAAALRAEFDEDFREGTQVFAPLQSALPVLRLAIRRRLFAVSAAFARGIFNVVFGLLLVPLRLVLVPLAVLGFWGELLAAAQADSRGRTDDDERWVKVDSDELWRNAKAQWLLWRCQGARQVLDDAATIATHLDRVDADGDLAGRRTVAL